MRRDSGLQTEPTAEAPLELDFALDGLLDGIRIEFDPATGSQTAKTKEAPNTSSRRRDSSEEAGPDTEPVSHDLLQRVLADTAAAAAKAATAAASPPRAVAEQAQEEKRPVGEAEAEPVLPVILWDDTLDPSSIESTVKRRFAAPNEEMLRIPTGVEDQFAAMELPAFADRMAIELMGELGVDDAKERAVYDHVIAEALRQSTNEQAFALARELDGEALDFDPNFLPSHLSNIAQAWRTSRWEECALLLGRLATQIEVVGDDHAVLRASLSALYVQLELLFEVRVGRDLSTLAPLIEHTSSLDAGDWVSALNALRYAFSNGDVSEIAKAYPLLIGCAPQELREGLALDLVMYLWRTRRNPAQAIEAMSVLSDTVEISDEAHLALLQLLSWSALAPDLEVFLTQRWAEVLRGAEGETQRQAAFIHRLDELRRPTSLVIGTAEQESRRAMECDETNVLYPLERHLYQLANVETPNADDSALNALIERCTSSKRKGLLAFHGAYLAQLRGDSTSRIEALDKALLLDPECTPARTFARHQAIAEKDYEQLWRIAHTASEHSLQYAAEEGEVLENLLQRFPEAFEAYSRAIGALPGRFDLVRALERTAHIAGQESSLIRVYGQAIASQADFDVQFISRKRAQLAFFVDEDPQISQALEACLGHLAFEPNDFAAKRLLLEIYLTRGDHADAFELTSMMLAESGEIELFEIQTRCASGLGEAGLVEEAMGRLADAEPGNPLSTAAQRGLMLQSGDWQAIESLSVSCASQATGAAVSAALHDVALVASGPLGDPRRALKWLEGADFEAPAYDDLYEDLLVRTAEWQALVKWTEQRAGRVDADQQAEQLYKAANIASDRLSDDGKAIELLERSLAINKTNTAAWRDLGTALWNSKEWERLSTTLLARLEAANSATERHTLLHELGFVSAFLLGDMGAAEQAYHQLLADDPKDPTALRGLARIYAAAGDESSLAEAFGRLYHAVDGLDDGIPFLVQQKLVLEAAGELPLSWLHAMLNELPNHPVVELAMLEVLHSRHDRREALELLKARPMSSLSLEQSMHLSAMAHLHLELGELSHARDLFAVASQTSPEYLTATLNLIAVDDVLGNQKAAAKSCEALAAQLTSPPAVRALLEAAEHRWRKAECRPDADRVHALRNELSDEGERIVLDPASPDQLIQFYTHVAATAPNEVQRGLVQLELARLEALGEDSPLTAVAFPHIVEAARHLPDIQQLRGLLILYALSDVLSAETRDALKRTLEGVLTWEEMLELWLLDAQRIAQLGEMETAKRALYRVLEVDPSNRRALHHLADIAWESEDLEGSTEWLSKLASVTRDRGLKAALEEEVALIHDALLNHAETSVKHLLWGLQTSPKSPSMLYFASRALESVCRWEDAVRLLIREAECHNEGREYRNAIYRAARIAGRRLGATQVTRALADRLNSSQTDVATLDLCLELDRLNGTLDKTNLLRAVGAAPSGARRARFAWHLSRACTTEAETLAWLGDALDGQPGHASAAFDLELLARRANREDYLYEALTARALGTGDPQALLEALEIVKRNGEMGRAKELLQDYVGRGGERSGSFDPCLELARLARLQGERELELFSLHKALAGDMAPWQRSLYGGRLGSILSTQEATLSDAIALWRDRLSENPADDYAYDRLSALLSRSGDFESLLELKWAEAEVFQHEQPFRADQIRWEIGETLAHRLGRPDEALMLFEQGSSTSPHINQFWGSAARLLTETNRRENLARRFEGGIARVASASGAATLGIEAAVIHEGLGNRADALRVYEAVLGRDPGNLYAADGCFRLRLAGGEGILECLELLAQIEDDPAYRAALYYVLGSSSERSGNLPKARESYEAAILLDSSSVLANLAWQRCCVQSQDYSAYIAWLEEAARFVSRPRAIEYLTRLTVLAQGEASASAWSTLRAYDPNNLYMKIAAMQWALARRDLRDLSRACAELVPNLSEPKARQQMLRAALIYSSVLDVPHLDAPMWRLMAECPHDLSAQIRLLARLEPNSDPQQVQRVYKALVKGSCSDSERANQWLSLGLYLASTDNLTAAQTPLKEIAKLQPNLLPAIKLQRFLAEALGSWEQVAEYSLAEAAESRAQAVCCLMHAARIRRDKLDDIAGAMEVFRKVLERDPLHEEAFSTLETHYQETGENSGLLALVMARAQACEDPVALQALLERAASLRGEGPVEGGAESLIEARAKLVELDPNNLGGYEKLAEAYAASDRWDDAVSCLERIIPRAAENEELLGRIYLRLGEIFHEKLVDPKRAKSALNKVLRYQPRSLVALNRLAEVYESSAAYSKCLETLEQLETLTPRKADRAALLQRCILALLKWFNDPEGAEKKLVALRKVDPSDVAGLNTLAAWYHEKGLSSKRVELLEHSYADYRDTFSSDPTNTDPLRGLFLVACMQRDADRNYVLSATLSSLGAARPEEENVYKTISTGPPPELAKPTKEVFEKLQPSILHNAFVELMQETDKVIAKISPYVAMMRPLSKKYRIRAAARPETADLDALAAAFGIELPPLYVVPDDNELAVLPYFMSGRETSLLFKESDLGPAQLQKTKFMVAAAAASLSLGISTFKSVNFPTFLGFMQGIFLCLDPERAVLDNPELKANAEAVSRAMPRKVRDVFKTRLDTIEADLNETGLSIQYQALQLTCYRYALVTLRDIGPGLELLGAITNSGILPIQGGMGDMLKFVVSDEHFEVRKALGSALT